jgi:hypothetical protein
MVLKSVGIRIRKHCHLHNKFVLVVLTWSVLGQMFPPSAGVDVSVCVSLFTTNSVDVRVYSCLQSTVWTFPYHHLHGEYEGV